MNHLAGEHRPADVVAQALIIQDKIADRFQGPLLLLVELNPFASYLNLYRWSFLGLPLSVKQFGVAVGWSVLALVWGFRFFRRAELRYGRG